jgi:plasmid stabilization system protein ParE
MELAWSADAVDDVERALDYISNDLASPMAAEHLLRSILKKAQLFSDFPGAGTVLRTQGGIDTGYRYMICGNWMVFFTLDGSLALVVRVLYGKSDYMRTLFGEIEG